MSILKHAAEQSRAAARFSGTIPLIPAVIVLALGCGHEATAPQQRPDAALQAAPAAKPTDHFHERITGSFSGEICGINATVDFVLVQNVFVHADGSFEVATSGRVTYTNPANGKSVVESFAGLRPSASAPIVDTEAGTVTFVSTFKGLPVKLQTPNGPVLLRDAGLITIADTFDSSTGEFISTDVTITRGPHPHADSDFTAYCEVLASALT